MRPYRLSPFFIHSVRVLGAGTFLIGLAGCTELARFVSKPEAKPKESVVAEETAPPQPVSEVVEKPKPSPLYEWRGDGRPVSRIVIDTNEQRARFYVGDEEIGWSTVATGLPNYATPIGQFAVMEKVENKRSNLYGKVVKGNKVVKSNAKAGRDPIPAGARFEGARMPYFMRLTNDGIGLHAGPIPRPGRPASHGCIRLPSKLAPVLFSHVSYGTQVSIVGKGPSYGNYVEKQRIAAARAAEQRRVAQQKAAAAAAATAGGASGVTTAPPQVAAQPTEPASTRSSVLPDAGQAPAPAVADAVTPAVASPSTSELQAPASEATEVPSTASGRTGPGPAAESAPPLTTSGGGPASDPQAPIGSTPAAASTAASVTPPAPIQTSPESPPPAEAVKTPGPQPAAVTDTASVPAAPAAEAPAPRVQVQQSATPEATGNDG
ncbi:MAG: L,D-transpeptidase family protein [Thiocapsa sp.]|nr:L,D-transpeptidase family protein [Thiocapsa sp.]MCG6895677.1 L,D-transpeptidase family protein [Thiocapsa sp.]